MQKSNIYNFSDDQFKQIIAENNSWCACARALGLSPYGSNSKIQIKKRIEELNCDISHFSKTAAMQAANKNRIYNLEEIMVENSTYTNTTKLKERIIRENILPYKCAICGNEGEWLGHDLSLQLDHINGKHFDHRKENLRFLCPNCHSQTETFSGKNK